MKKLAVILMVLLMSGYLAAQDRDCIRWVKARNGDIPVHAVVGGEENGQPLYIARAIYKSGIHPGKIGRGWKGCNISYNGDEISLYDYEVLVYNNQAPGRSQGSRTSIATSEMRDVMDSFPNDRKLGTYAKDSELRTLSSKLTQVQKTALRVKNYKLNDSINDMKKYLSRRFLKRDDVKRKLEDLYEIARKTD